MTVELTGGSLYRATRGETRGRQGCVRAFNAPEAESLFPGNLRSCSFFLPGRKKRRLLYAKLPLAVAEGHVKVKSIPQLSQPGQCPLSQSGSQRNTPGDELAGCLGTARSGSGCGQDRTVSAARLRGLRLWSSLHSPLRPRFLV